MAMGNYSFLMVVIIQGFLRKIGRKVMGVFIILMGIIIKGSLRITWRMAMESIMRLLGGSFRVCGKRIRGMGRGRRLGLMGPFFKGGFKITRNLGMENSSISMGTPLLGKWREDWGKVKGSWSSKMEGNTKENGRKEKWRAKESSTGQLASDTKVIIKKIKNMEKANCHIVTGRTTTAHGDTACGMALEHW